ncbi:bifunctional endoribonuclease/protein kinase ire1 [Cryptotrichosporon argae]
MHPLLLGLLVAFLGLGLILASPSPEPFPLVSLPHTPVAGKSRSAARSREPSEELDADVLPFVIISTLDGALHAVDRATGNVRWTLRDGVEPLVGGGVRGKGTEEFIVEPLSGGLYVFEDEDTTAPKVRKLPLSVEQLVELSPFTFPHSPSRVFTGSKQTSLLTLDLRTGQQLDCFSSHTPWNLSGDADRADMCETDALDDLEAHARRAADTLFVGRTDYRLTIHSQSAPWASSVASSAALTMGNGKGVTQDIVYSTYTPNSYDRALADMWAKGERKPDWMRVELGHDGVAVGVREGEGSKWVKQLGSVGIAVYDVILPHSSPSASPVILPQPPPNVDSLFPVRAQRHPALDKPPSTYIGSVPFSLSIAPPSVSNVDDRAILYALSSSAYPLINFAPPPRPGALANGSFVITDDMPDSEQLLPYLLDPPKDAAVVPELAPSMHGGRIRERGEPRHEWWRYPLGALGVLSLLGLFLARYSRQGALLPSAAPGVRVEKVAVVIPPSAVTPTTALLSPDDTPKKKSTRRRVRGKKKKPNSSEAGDDDDEEVDNEKGSSSASVAASPNAIEKPLPELPREFTSTGLPEDKERLVISDKAIGFGSHGTVVLKGTWGGRPVAVKRLLSDFVRLASQEVKLLQASDDHPNVIRYYCQERRDNFLYIALDLCDASLADLIESPGQHAELASSLDRKHALTQITAGLKHLHGMKIIHRDIKPQNVLVSRGRDGALRMLVSDFGLARRLDQGQSSFAPTANNLAGSLGWRAPECIRGNVRLNDGFEASAGGTLSDSGSSQSLSGVEGEERDARDRLTKAVDLFALGCLYFWVLLSGEHPYGETYNRESNIVKGDAVNLGMLDVLGEEGVEAKELIGRMLHADPNERPETSEALLHPFFWTPAKRLTFLCDASDRFEIMDAEASPPESALVVLETDAVAVVGKDWKGRLDRTVIADLNKRRTYRGESVQHLLRALRNKKHHYQDLDATAKKTLGQMPAGFLHYWTSRFPRLFLHVHGVVRDGRLRHEAMFEGYFRESA